jgi:hypothetical protein
MDGLVLGPFASPPTGQIHLQIDFEADEPGSLDVMWRRTAGESFTRAARTQLPIGPGRDQREIELPALGAECELMLRPTTLRPAIVVHKIKVLSAEPP